ncbi:MAG: PilZ domain-containing protein [Firmicutes bacterium]|nr:PilZ domain-containing protein [Bacillota bacterium]
MLNRLLRPGKIIKLKFDISGFKRSIQAYIIRNPNPEHLTLLFKDNEPLVYHLPPETGLKLISRDEEDGHDYRLLTELIEVKQGELPRVVVKRPTEVDYSTRRSFMRLDVNLPFSYYDNFKEQPGEVRNLSITGLLALVKTTPSLKLNHSLTCKFTLPDNSKPLIIIGKIIRLEEEDPEHTWVALDFQSASEEIKNRISRYLVQRQRHLINIKKKLKKTQDSSS